MRVFKPTTEEQLNFIYEYERTFVIILKLGMILAVTILTSLINPNVWQQSGYYNGYLIFALTWFYFFYYFRIARKNLKTLKFVSFLSFAHDIAFATYFLQFTGGRTSSLHYAFAMYFIRAAISYPTIEEILFSGFGIFTPIYVFGLYNAEKSLAFLLDKQFYIQYGFLWGIIISCFGVVSLLNQKKQKIEKQLKEIRSLQEQLIQAEKLAGLGQLAGGIAHELNNPLGSILGFSQMVLRECNPENQQFKDLARIEQAALRCKKIIDSLLSFSRQSKMEKSTMNLHQIIEDTLALCEYEMRKRGIEKKLDFDPDLPKVYADTGQIQQVLMNLFLNAIDAMPDGGELTVKTAHTKNFDGEKVTVVVGDTGRGIAQEHLPKIFDPFFTTKEVGKGTGLGLSIVYGIIQRHQGTIEVHSKPGRGTEFKIVLPILKKTQQEQSKVYA